MKYKRVLLKLSGEALMGSKNSNIDPAVLEQYSEEIKAIQKEGVELAIVIGGGNIFRGGQAEALGIDRVQGDYMGMLATVINGLASPNPWICPARGRDGARPRGGSRASRK